MNAPRPQSDRQHGAGPRGAVLGDATKALFLVFITLSLIAPSLTGGPFNWLPFLWLDGIEETTVGVGPLTLLPGIALIAWMVARVIERPRRSWCWGRPNVTLPLAGLTLIMLGSLEPTVDRRTVLALFALGTLWWVYLFMVNETPNVTIALSLVIVIQSVVAIAQFASQGDLGLDFLGEPALEPQQSGTCVLFARGRRWLRAYGLSGHPNLLGGLLGVALLMIADDIAGAHRGRRAWFTLVATAGLLGQLTAFSRGAWLSFGAGLFCWMMTQLVTERGRRDATHRTRVDRPSDIWRRLAPLLIPTIVGAVFLVLFHDLVASRLLNLETPVEAPSLGHRQLDARLAMRLIRQHPWSGVGLNNYLPAIRAVEPNSRIVHNVLLLVAAELGLPGAVLWLWLTLTALTRPASSAWPAWVAMTIFGIFDVALYPTNSQYATIAFALLAAQASSPGPVSRLSTPAQASAERCERGER